MKIIKELTKQELKEFLYSIDLNDQNLYQEINKDNIFGIFQFDGNTANSLIKKIKPKNFEELVAINALARPGTIDFADEYNQNKETGNSRYPHQLDALLKDTYNLPLYQEQVMAIFNQIGGFSLEDTNTVRSLMKKLSKADKDENDLKKWNEIVNRFTVGAIEKGLTKKEANNIADDLLKMSNYSFNRSHAVAYTYTAIMTLYLSCYFKSYFIASTLTYEAEKQENLKRRINDSKMLGYKILPPNINKSKVTFYVQNNEIRFGLNEIKFVGKEVAKKIVDNAPYTSILDFYVKNIGNRVTSRTVTALIESGAFDEFINGQRKKYSFIYNKFNEEKKTTKVIEKLEYLWKNLEKQADSIPGLETTNKDLIEYEKQYFGFVLFNSIFDNKMAEFVIELNKRGLCELYIDDLNTKDSIRIPLYVESYRILNDKNGKEMAFLNCVDLNDSEIKIPIFQSYWNIIKQNFSGEGFYLLYLYKDKEKDNEIFFGKNTWPSDEEKKRLLKRIK